MMHEGELSIDAPAVEKLVAAAFPHLAHEPVRRVDSIGTVNALFRIGSFHAARFPLLPVLPVELENEMTATTQLAEIAPLPVARILEIVPASSTYPSAWSLQSWVPGRTADSINLGDTGHELLVHDFARLISAFRAHPVSGREFDGNGRGGRFAEHHQWVEHCLEQSSHLFDTQAVRTLWARLTAVDPPKVLVLSHRDLLPANLIMDDTAAGLRLAGVIDGGAFGPADPALDLIVAWNLFGQQDRRMLRKLLHCTDAQWHRAAAWALEQSVGLGWYYEQSNPQMCALGLETIDRLLADLDLR
ncbi:phosphotransferase [Glutamicibacter sp.]|uniref:phosphotransferase n=1 Tax=Glutamicibacter sp. TaxID=1931995 RepID=UPI0028BE8096|nr:phosphotransferase [Glutamicibacter sp.]